MRLEPDYKAQRSLERIANDRRRASEVIDRLRALAKRQVPCKGRFDLNEVILEVLALRDDEVRRNEILVETSLDVDLPTVECDRIQIQQIILNLIINAIETMSAVDDRRRQLAISSAKEGTNAVRVEVRDSGPGVDPSHADRLFEAFYTTKAEGMGMGLSISRAIIRGPRRTVVGESERAPRCRLLFLAADGIGSGVNDDRASGRCRLLASHPLRALTLFEVPLFKLFEDSSQRSLQTARFAPSAGCCRTRTQKSTVSS